VIRAIPLEVPTIEALNLPPVLKEPLANAPNGVVLVTGPEPAPASRRPSPRSSSTINRTRARRT